mmetsp:Transcript_9823/g.18651  ORF Transcript_9823/g.18651 Transcript_9823/m.18651 type:complete len:188 (-) Transcript_9823:93-656(-)
MHFSSPEVRLIISIVKSLLIQETHICVHQLLLILEQCETKLESCTAQMLTSSPSTLISVVKSSVINSKVPLALTEHHLFIVPFLFELLHQFLNFRGLTIQKDQLVFREAQWQQIGADWNAQFDDNRKSNSDLRDAAEHHQADKNENLDEGVHVRPSMGNIFGKWLIRKAGPLHEEHIEAVPKFVTGK